MMKIKKSLFAGVLMLACLVSAHAQNLDGEAKKKLTIAGAVVGKAIDVHDVAALEKLWSPKLLVNSPSNHVLTRAEVFDAIKLGQLDYESGYKSKIEKIVSYGPDAVTMADEILIPISGQRRARQSIAAAPTSASTPTGRGR